MPTVDSCGGRTGCIEGANNHFRMLIPGKFLPRANHAVIQVPCIVEYRSATGPPPDAKDILRLRVSRYGTVFNGASERLEVRFRPWVLVPPEDDTWSVGV